MGAVGLLRSRGQVWSGAGGRCADDSVGETGSTSSGPIENSSVNGCGKRESGKKIM